MIERGPFEATGDFQAFPAIAPERETTPNNTMASVRARVPLILEDDQWAPWLKPVARLCSLNNPAATSAAAGTATDFSRTAVDCPSCDKKNIFPPNAVVDADDVERLLAVFDLRGH